MIVSILKGGLGNQMFQYALGRSLSLVKNVDLSLETSHFSIEKVRKYELSCFDINISSASISLPFKNKYQIDLPSDSLEDNLNQLPSIILSVNCNLIDKITPHRIINSFIPLQKKYCYYEKHYEFDESVFLLNHHVVLDGYWQSEKYFKNIETVIRNDFSFRFNPDEKNQQFINQITSCNAVSIHVRRGDYASNKEIQSIHGLCSLNYYKSAIALISRQVDNPHFFVFSDDILWCQENLIFLDYPVTFITHNLGGKSYQDMRLMSYCKHNIIANSSFSWWGAWLNCNSNKIVISPSQWFARPTINSQDVIPANWIKV